MNNEIDFILALELKPEEIMRMPEQERLVALKKAYKTMAKKWHPDRATKDSLHPKDFMQMKFIEVTHAYKMLTDNTYRHQHFMKAQGTKQVNLHAVLQINLTFEQAFFGCKTTLTFNATYLNEEGEPLSSLPEEESDKVTIEVDVITLNVMAGTKAGDKHKLPGRGLKQGDRRGDLIFCYNVQPHKRFAQEDQENPFHLKTSEEVPLDVMLAGGEREVLTMWGIKTFRIPAGTRPNDEIKMVNLGKDKKGAHSIRIVPKYPEKDDLKNQKLWKKLNINWDKEGELDEKERKEEEDYEKLFEELGGYDAPEPAFTVRFTGGAPRW